MAKTPLDLAMAWMDAFFGNDPNAMRPLLADDLAFEGPQARFDSAEAYLVSLEASPPEGEYELLEAFENGDTACLIYRFIKPGIDLPMAQVFTARGEKIKVIRLIFDSAPFR